MRKRVNTGTHPHTPLFLPSRPPPLFLPFANNYTALNSWWSVGFGYKATKLLEASPPLKHPGFERAVLSFRNA
jgi:hypothetical protein